MNRSDVEVAVIGAGPYGLATASYLIAQNRSVVVLGEVMATWRAHMPAGMFLKSTPRASSIADPQRSHTFARFREASGQPPVDDHYPIPIEEFIAYGDWFSNELVPVVADRVKRLEKDRDGFVLTLDSGDRIGAKAVVSASGVVDFAFLPESLLQARADGARCWHTSEFNDLASLSGAELAVIGGGQSALEVAVLAREAGANVHLLVRKPSLLFGNPPGSSSWKPESLLGPGWSLLSMERLPSVIRRMPAAQRDFLMRRILGPSGAWWLRPRFADVDVRLGITVQSAKRDGDGVVLEQSNGDQLKVDCVIAATGYRPELNRIGYLSDDLRRQLGGRGAAPPRLGPNFDTKVRGLFLTGLGAAPTFGPLFRFVAGTQFAASHVTRGIGSILTTA